MKFDNDSADGILGRKLPRRKLLQRALAGAAAAGLVACESTDKTTQTAKQGADRQSRPAATPLPDRSASGTNAIVIVLDSLRADHLGCYGNDWIKTPNMDALAGESILFTRAFPQAMPTIPMRLVLHTGQQIWPYRQTVARTGANSLWAGWGPIPEEDVSLSEILEKENFQTGIVTDTYHYWAPGMNFHRGFRQYVWVRGQELDGYRSPLPVTQEQVDAVFDPDVSGDLEGMKLFSTVSIQAHLANQAGRTKEEDYQTPRVFNEALKWLEESRNAGRFFLLLDAFDPHEPWDPPQEYVDMYDPDYSGRGMIAPLYSTVNYLSEPELKQMRARYAAEVTFSDKWLGIFLDGVRQLGMLDDTLLIFTSDHGHQLAEHDIIGKLPQGMFYELMDVPLMVRRPGGEGAGRRVDALVQHQDIMPTVLNYLEVAPAAPLPGLDLVDLAEDRIQPRDHVSSGLNAYSWCRDSRYTFMMLNDGGDQRLYDMNADPLQTRNLATEDKSAAEKMKRKLLEDAGGSLLA
jgi:arylsulfatase A-like enzyme